MENNTKKHTKLTAFTVAIPDTNTILQGHMNPHRLPIIYVLNTMAKIDALPVNTIANFMENN